MPENKEKLICDLKVLGFETKEENSIIIASKKSYWIGGGKVWTDDHKMIIDPKKYNFKMEPKRHNLVFVPIS